MSDEKYRDGSIHSSVSHFTESVWSSTEEDEGDEKDDEGDEEDEQGLTHMDRALLGMTPSTSSSDLNPVDGALLRMTSSTPPTPSTREERKRLKVMIRWQQWLYG